MRLDTTVVETNIHYPTDSNLLGDGVRVLIRAMKRITEIAGQPLSEYAVGVRTMEQAAADDAMMFVNDRWMSVGVLFWLAWSPVFRRPRSRNLGAAPERELAKEFAAKKESA